MLSGLAQSPAGIRAAPASRTNGAVRLVRSNGGGGRDAMGGPSRDEVALAARHVAEGESRCARLAAFIILSRAQGFDVTQAERMLAIFEETLRLMREHHARLSREAQRA
jgi:hypothetical protein